MPRDILREYGPDSHKPQASPASSGGVESAKDVMHYEPPVGPTSVSINGPWTPGLHEDNYGPAQKPSGGTSSGSPGNHGTNYGNKGTQGSY